VLNLGEYLSEIAAACLVGDVPLGVLGSEIARVKSGESEPDRLAIISDFEEIAQAWAAPKRQPAATGSARSPELDDDPPLCAPPDRLESVAEFLRGLPGYADDLKAACLVGNAPMRAPPPGEPAPKPRRRPIADGLAANERLVDWPKYVMARDLAGPVFPVSEDVILQIARKHNIGRKMGRAVVFSSDEVQRLY
jgi:hypothetical protein